MPLFLSALPRKLLICVVLPLILNLSFDLQAGVKLISPAGYLPNVPYLVRVELVNASGVRDRNAWSSEAILSVDQPQITLSTNKIEMKNGLGTALLVISGTGDFNLTAAIGNERLTKAVRSLSGQAVQQVSGTLAGTATTWSGVIRVTGDLTVPAGHTLTIQPNTLIMLDGVSSGSTAPDILVSGAIRGQGTEAAPISITCADAGLNWGQIRHDNAQPSLYQYTLITKAGRASGEGHTGSGPAVRPSNSTITFENSVISDLTFQGATIGKTMQASGSALTFDNCVLARSRMGPEIEGTSLNCTNSHLMEMRGPDDADGIYLHGAGNRVLLLSACVIAGGDDDAVDTLDSNVTVENCIIRDWPNPNEDAKGVSAFHGEVMVRRSLIANCFAGIASKSSGSLAVVRVENSTVLALGQGISAVYKSNAEAGNINFYLRNSIVRSADALYSDFGPEKFASVTYCNLSESWPGAGNFTADPLFMNAAAGDFRLQPGSPCIDAGDPASPSDPNGSPADLGAFASEAPSTGFFVSITSPAQGAVIAGPTNVLLSANVVSSTGTVSRVEFFDGARKVGEDTTSPYSYLWLDVPLGDYTVRAVGTRTGGLMATSAPVSFSITTGEGPATNVFVQPGSFWKYLDDGTDQGTNWIQLAFNDNAWKTGQAELGYGDNDEITPISFGPSASSKYPTYYFRQKFFVEDATRVSSLIFGLNRDDGAVVYLNGREVYRISMPLGDITYGTFATEASDYSWDTRSGDPSFLVTGTNIVAVEVHQGNAGSSDVSFDFGLAGIVEPPRNAKPLVVLNSPSDNLMVGAPANLTLTASAQDPDGSVSKVSFYANGAWLGDDTTSPYAFAWNNVAANQYALTVVAVDATGLSSTSKVVNITVSTNTAPPRILSITPPPGPVTNLTQLTVTFSKEVRGVDAADLLVNGVPCVRVTGAGTRYAFEFSEPAPGTRTLTWSPSHGIVDTFTPAGAFDHSSSGASWQYAFSDGAPPQVQTVDPAPRSMLSVLTSISITFNEAVTGVNAADLLINSRPATSISGSGAGPYVFSFAQPPSGLVTISWAEGHGIRDAGNNDLAVNTWTYDLDTSAANVVISEIMYHPVSENLLDEWIELHNRGAAAVNLAGWRFTEGVEFTFPNVSIPAGGYLVVAANIDRFRGAFSNVTNVVGNWTGWLSNSREDIDLEDARGNLVDSVAYADEGEWAIRRRGPNDRGFRGWIWFSEHDGLGRSLELINPKISNNNGQNWASSRLPQNTPGRANSVLTNNIPPIIENVAHYPLIPKSTNDVQVSAKVTDDLDLNATVTLQYRVDAVTPPAFTTIPMRDDGAGPDAAANDGVYSAVIPAQTNNTVVEFFISAADSSGKTRFWPAPAIAAVDGTGPAGQVANALYQVDDSVYAGVHPLYKIIMTETERRELQSIGDNIGGSSNSDAQMNATFIGLERNGAELRYLASVRNRGHGSRSATPNNFRVNFRSDEDFNGATGLNLNSQFSWLQTLGAALNLKAGLVGAYSRPVEVRINNANLAFEAGTGRTFGVYAANEAINGDWADLHFPDDGNGNVYRAIRDFAPSDFDYRTTNVYPTLSGPENPNSYRNTWFKESNVSEDDWTDLIGMLRVFGLNGTVPFSEENLSQVINIDQWLKHLAVMNIMANGETGLNSGYNDDYFMYRGVTDPRFILMYYDLDSVLGFGSSLGSSSSLFTSTTIGGAQRSGPSFERFLADPVFRGRYLAIYRELLNTTFSSAEFNATVDQVLGDYVPDNTRTQLKNWMDQRRTFALSQLPATDPPKAPLASVSGFPRSPTPLTSASLAVSGQDLTHYRFTLNGGPLSPEAPISAPITLSNLPNGTNTLIVIGKNSAGVYQSTAAAPAFRWVVNSSLPAVRLNEVIASRAGNLPDQIELFNESATTVNLMGMRLTDDLSTPGKFTFASLSLPPGGFLILDADQLGFAFDRTGDALFLLDAPARGGALLDSVRFGLQLTGSSIGRIGASGEWRLCQPTFGAANIIQNLGNADNVRINEWLADGASPYPDDFVELHNPESLPVSIGGMYLTDQQAGAPRRSPIAPLSFIAAGGFAAFTSGDGNTADEINFALAAEQGELALLAGDLSLIDSVIYNSQRLGVSMGRCPDGSTTVKFLNSPTPGGFNDCPAVPQPPQTITVIPISQVWKYDQSGTDLGTTWKNTNYNDSAWPSGPGMHGFETSTLAEPIRTQLFLSPTNITYYFRTLFNYDVRNASVIQVGHLIDDGAAFYLNGVEIGPRFNLATNANYQTGSGRIGNAAYQFFTFPPSALRQGTNLFAVEVHQENPGNGDMVFGLRLDAIIATNSVAQSGVMINEVLAQNASMADADGAKPDWIELYNPSSNAVDLAGMSISDDVTNPRRWVFPAGSLMNARGYFRVRFNPDAAMSSTNTGFALNANGGAVYLFNPPSQGGLQSSIAYGLQATDWSIGRVPDGSTNWVLTIPTIGARNVAATLGNQQNLRINEWMANPASGDDWFELFNPNSEPVSLSGLALSDSLTDRLKYTIPALSFLGNGVYGFQRFDADDNLAAGANHVNFKLSGSGESLAISSASGVLIHGVSFGLQISGVSQGFLPDGSTNLVEFPVSASPGDSNFLPLQELVINELLSHSDPPLMDAVEIYNPTGDDVNIGQWYLSDSGTNLRKYQIPVNTIVRAGGFVVLYESQFNSDAAIEPFSFSSSDGDQVFLSKTVGGALTGYRAFAEFGPAENGVSFGRFPTSQGFHFVPLAQRTFGRDNPATTNEFVQGIGASNAPAKVGPIVISEIMYNPASTNDALEFIELRNITGSTISLAHPLHPQNTWRVRKGVDYNFAPGVSIPAGGHLVLVSFSPQSDPAALAAFEAAYGTNATSVLFGPYSGKLKNSGDTIELQKPDAPQLTSTGAPGQVPYIMVDRVDFRDVAPWPYSPDGGGDSLQKNNALLYGNEPLHWGGALASPGRPNGTVNENDSDNDGMPNDWESAYGLKPNDPSDANLDPDADGFTNRQEYFAGTNPINPASVLRAQIRNAGFGNLMVAFTAAAGKAYTIEFRDSFLTPWQKLIDIPSSTTERLQEFQIPANRPTRFYRIVLSQSP